ncbi:ATP-binding protein [Streptomyces sp. NPDC057509]|uniref:ATP-binding protein n=1 Tax=Streptomyces sp. NPDC057509 TaxID=3346152 RepID=UPI0036CF866E
MTTTADAMPLSNTIQTGFEVSIQRTTAPNSARLSEADACRPGSLRRVLGIKLKRWRVPELIEPAGLLLSELVTNALIHGQGDVGIRVHLAEGRCVIAVRDGSSARPRLRRADAQEEGGRGLLLVDALAAEWGVSPDGTTTWCSLHVNEGPSTMPTPPALRDDAAGDATVSATLSAGSVAA